MLFTRSGCHLCEPARALVAELASAAGVAWREVDVDGDPELVERFGELVPVVTVDGVVQGYWRLDAAHVARALR